MPVKVFLIEIFVQSVQLFKPGNGRLYDADCRTQPDSLAEQIGRIFIRAVVFFCFRLLQFIENFFCTVGQQFIFFHSFSIDILLKFLLHMITILFIHVIGAAFDNLEIIGMPKAVFASLNRLLRIPIFCFPGPKTGKNAGVLFVFLSFAKKRKKC